MRIHSYDPGQRYADPVRAAAARFRMTTAWQRFRVGYVRRHPHCRDPLSLHPASPRRTLHVWHVSRDVAVALVESNCLPVCAWCAQRLERLEREGNGPAGLFTATPHHGDGHPPAPGVAGQNVCTAQLHTDR